MKRGFLNFETVGADAELFRMSRVSRPNSAWNKSYAVKREVGETELLKLPMKRGPLSGDANLPDLGQVHCELWCSRASLSDTGVR